MDRPNIVCVGAQKAGTTWLFEQLVKHPAVTRPSIKELNFFSRKHSSYTYSKHSNFDNGFDWYVKQLNCKPGKLSCDFSPDYLWDDDAAGRLHSFSPNCKIIIILREPVERAYSQYIHAKKTFFVGDNFEEAIKNHPDILERSYYSKSIENFINIFPKYNVKIFFYEDLKNNNEEFLRKIYQFLELKPYFNTEYKKRVNPALYPKFQLINKITSNVYRLKNTKAGAYFWRNSFFKKIGNKIIKAIKAFNLQEEPSEMLSKQARDRVNDLFVSDKADLEKILGYKVPWN